MIRWCVLVVVFTAVAVARADDMPDGGVADAPPDAPAAVEAPPAATEPAAEPAPTEPAPAEPGPEKKHKKKKDKQDSATWATDQGDIVGNDLPGGVTAGGVGFRFLFQTRYRQSFADREDPITILDPRLDDGYALNRVFLRATTKPKPWLNAKLLVDFAELSHRTPKKALKLAYADVALHPRAVVTVGLFKRPYSLLELLPIAEYEFADSGPTDSLIKDAELGGRDIGVMLRVDPLRKRKWLSVYLGAFDGGLGGADARPAGLLVGRAITQPSKHWRLGVDGAWRPRGQHPPGGIVPETGPGRATSADLTYARKHFQLRGEWLWGTRSDEINAGAARTFMAAWGIAAYGHRVCNVIVMPAVRVEWLDADREHPIGQRFYLSGAVNVMDLSDTFRVVVDVSRSQVQRGSFPLSVAPVLLDTSSTIVAVQAQVKI